MKQIKLINSRREVLDLRAKEHRINEASFHESEWTYKSIENRFGITIEQFTKKPLELEIDILFNGKDTRENLNRFFESFEQDILRNTPSKLIWGDWFIEGFVTSSEVHPSEKPAGTIKSIKILAPYPFWMKEKRRAFLPEKRSGTELNISDYPYDYPCGYSARTAGRENWNLGNIAESDFKLQIFGPCTNPEIVINEHAYIVYKELLEGDYIEIDSKKHTVYYFRSDGIRENIFNLRGKSDSVFEKLPAGNLTVSWSGNFGFDISAIVERGEPAW